MKYEFRKRIVRHAFTTLSLICVASVVLTSLFFGFPIRAAQITPALIQTIDLGVVTARVSVIGAIQDHHLSGDVGVNDFTTFPRAQALASGDFNNDGFDDVAIGAPDADFTPTGGEARSEAGAVYIVFGQNNFAPTTVIDTNLASSSLPNTRIFGIASDDHLGAAVAVGDINGDGFDDLLMGATGRDFNDTTRTDTGAVFVLFGATNFPQGNIDLAAAGSANLIIVGERSGDRFGSSIATGNIGGATDIADILIGAPGNTGPADDRADGGAAYIVFGATTLGTGGGLIDLGTTTASVSIFGRTGSLLGSALSIGDVNGTAPADLLVGAPLANRPDLPTETLHTGGAFVFFGGVNLNPPAGTTSKTFDLNSAVVSQRPNVSIYGSDVDDHLGVSVATGDVTEDGNSDVLLGAPDADAVGNARSGAGEAYVIRGGTTINPPAGTTERRIDISNQTAALTFYGAAAGDHLGSMVKAVLINTTANNDLTLDLAIGVPGFDPPAKLNGGAVSVLFGGANLTLFAERDGALNQDDLRIVGQLAGDELGRGIAAGDLDNNGGGDIIVGAPFNDVTIAAITRAEAGRVYALFAAEENVPPINQPPVITVVNPNGGNSIPGGSNFNITWAAQDANGVDTIDRFEIRLSTDSGASFNTIIATNLAGTARLFVWNVPIGLNTTTARIRIIGFDDQGASGQDDSSENFSIGDIGITVVLATPNGGDTLRFAQVSPITWQVPEEIENQIVGFDLFLSTDGGTTFTTPIAFVGPNEPALAAGVRSFNWTVPSLCLTQARVIISARILNGTTSIDQSNSNFTIQDVGPTVDTARLIFNAAISKLTLRTTQPTGGTEVRFLQSVQVSLSSDQAGTTFFSFPSVNRNTNGNKVKVKGNLNGQTLNAFIPDQAIRVLRIVNPTCGVTHLTVRRQGATLVLFTNP